MPDATRHDPAQHDVAPAGLLLVAGRLWDGTGAGARRGMALAIRNGRVERVAPPGEGKTIGFDSGTGEGTFAQAFDATLAAIEVKLKYCPLQRGGVA